MKVDNQVQQAYDAQYASEDEAWRSLGATAKARNIIEIAGALHPKKVLEVGAGDGSILKFLNAQKFAPELYALEISSSGVEKIKSKNLSLLKDISLFDGYSIPYPDQHFDLVILSHVLEHVEFERTLLREIKRVSKYQVIEVPRDFRFGIDGRTEHFLAYGHINVYTPSSLKFLLRSEGFEIEKMYLRLYDKALFGFMAKGNAMAKLKGTLVYGFKSLMVQLPFKISQELFCNSITVLTKQKGQAVEIFT